MTHGIFFWILVKTPGIYVFINPHNLILKVFLTLLNVLKCWNNCRRVHCTLAVCLQYVFLYILLAVFLRLQHPKNYSCSIHHTSPTTLRRQLPSPLSKIIQKFKFYWISLKLFSSAEWVRGIYFQIIVTSVTCLYHYQLWHGLFEEDVTTHAFHLLYTVKNVFKKR